MGFCRFPFNIFDPVLDITWDYLVLFGWIGYPHFLIAISPGILLFLSAMPFFF